MKLIIEDIEMLLDWGFTKDDFPQIEEAMQKSKTKYIFNGKQISREEAIILLGERKYLAGISRSAFHFTACQEIAQGCYVYFDSTSLFRKE